MDASCGPTSALSQLSKHTQRDNSLQHEVSQQGHFGPRAGFRSQPGIDANLNLEFNNFVQGGGNADIGAFHGSMNGLPGQMNGFPGQMNNFHGQTTENQQWAQDFNRLSLNNNPQMHQQPQQPQQLHQLLHQPLQQHQSGQVPMTNWSQQFLQNSKQDTKFTPSFHQSSNFAMHQPVLQQTNLQLVHPSTGQTQFQQHEMQQEPTQMDDKAFDSHFDKISKEIEQMEQVEQLRLETDADKEAFARAAKQVENNMTSPNPLISNETVSKFQESSFLKLMSMISKREVEISSEGNKLVATGSGEDVRQYLSDPLKHERSGSSDVNDEDNLRTEHAPTLTGNSMTNESAHIRSHLPDPLAHIRDGELLADLTPLQAARVISGGQVSKDNWMENESWDIGIPRTRRKGILNEAEQEVFDDYRNDDDFH